MNMSKKINVNFSSLVGLKAELLRKQTEIKDSKAKEETQPKVAKPKARRKKIKDRTVKTEPGYTEIEDASTLRKSKLMLEAKTMLYDKLKKNGGDDGRNYLVDFGRKCDSSDDEFRGDDDYEDANSDPEDDWVEYEDCFGRTRKCLRRDLPKMREKDDMVKRDITKEPEPEARHEQPPVQPPVPAPIVTDKQREIDIMRKKWEEQMERLADKSDIHYQDVLFDEARAHGTGYYGFSQNEEERAKQQENLAKLRKETERKQRETQEARDSKSKMEFNRLKAATIRKKVRSGLAAELTNEEETELRAQIKLRNSNETQDDDRDTNPQALEAASRAVASESRTNDSLVVIEDKIKAFAELLGKRPKWHEMSQEEWVHKRRRDRLGEFAPVYENFRRSGSVRPTRDNRVTTRADGEEDPVRINATGPEPTDLWETGTPICRNVHVEDDIEKDAKEADDGHSRISDERRPIEESSKNNDDIDRSSSTAIVDTAPPSFINSFVPRSTIDESSLPVSFARTIPPPSIINFSVPPPSFVASASIPQIRANEITADTYAIDDSSDSDDSDVIGPVPPPSMNDFASDFTTTKCGPSLIDVEHLNMISEIPLPAALQFPILQDRSQNPAELSDNTQPPRPNNDGKTTDNSEAIAAGLKYLRRKFEQKH